MRLRLVYNAFSGYGRAAALADAFALALNACGHHVQCRPAGTGLRGAMANLESVDLLVLFGGDGTVHHALEGAIRSRVPIYHVPTGTENLFARDWGMDTRVVTLRDAIRRWRIVDSDAGLCDGRPFSLMCSAGFDAGIIHARCGSRRKADGHRGYVIPIMEQLADPVFPVVRVTVDGQMAIDNQRGVVIVANSRQYAMRLDPAIHAGPADGLLDIVFLPCSTPLGAVSWSLLARLRRHTGAPGIVYCQGRCINIQTTSGPAPWQIDGEPLGNWPARAGMSGNGASSAMSIQRTLMVAPGALRILDARIGASTDASDSTMHTSPEQST